MFQLHGGSGTDGLRHRIKPPIAGQNKLFSTVLEGEEEEDETKFEDDMMKATDMKVELQNTARNVKVDLHGPEEESSENTPLQSQHTASQLDSQGQE